jgi:hypothetical protein
MAVHLTRSACERFKKSAVYPMQGMGLMMICCGMTLKGTRMLAVSARKMKALTVKMETVILIGQSR